MNFSEVENILGKDFEYIKKFSSYEEINNYEFQGRGTVRPRWKITKLCFLFDSLKKMGAWGRLE